MSQKLADNFRAFVKYGDINWRTGVNGGILPYGHVVRSIAHVVQTMRKKKLPSGVFLHTDGVDMSGLADYSMLTKLTMLNNHIDEKDSEYDSDDDYQEELMANEMNKIKRTTQKARATKIREELEELRSGEERTDERTRLETADVSSEVTMLLHEQLQCFRV